MLDKDTPEVSMVLPSSQNVEVGRDILWDFCNSFLFPGPQFAYLCEEEIGPDLQTSTVSAHGNRLWMPHFTGEHHEPLMLQSNPGGQVWGVVEEEEATRLAKSWKLFKWADGQMDRGRKYCSVHSFFFRIKS